MATAPLVYPAGAGVEMNIRPPLIGFTSTLYGVSAGGAAVSVTADADSARPNTILQIMCSYTATPTGGSVKIEDGSGTTVWTHALAGAGPYIFTFELPMSGTINTAMIVTLAGGGGAIVGYLTAQIVRFN